MDESNTGNNNLTEESATNGEHKCRPVVQNAFDEERRQLLQGMATQLQDVIQKMARVNKNLESAIEDSDTVSQVTKLWRESYQIANAISKKEVDNVEEQAAQSSLLIYDRRL